MCVCAHVGVSVCVCCVVCMLWVGVSVLFVWGYEFGSSCPSSYLLLHLGVWTGIWIKKMEWNSEYTQLQLGTVKSSLSYLLIL